ncbi:terpenoid synthase [Ramaria rubella]|nr:terpenoid synthase [Ramaria rubella]
MTSLEAPRAFLFPDLVSYCNFPLLYHHNGDAVAAASEQWYGKGCNRMTEDQRRQLSALAAGRLSAYVYHDTNDERLRASCDLMHLIFFYGDLTDRLRINGNEMVADTMMNGFWFPHAYRPTHAKNKPQPEQEPDLSGLARDLWLRCIQDAGPGFQARFLENMGLFFEGRYAQAKHRESGVVPALDVYINIRRDSSGLKPLIDFFEYTLQIDLPDYVINNPIMQTMKQCVNDFCTWSNDLFSFNKEQACGDTYNMVVILMKTQGLNLQTAVDYVGDMCFKTLDAFCESQKNLPSWGPEIDRDVARYVCGLESWIVGGIHWSFISGRYFGKDGLQIKESRIVTLRPRKTARKTLVGS